MSPLTPNRLVSSLVLLCPLALLACGSPGAFGPDDLSTEGSAAGAAATASTTLVVNAGQVLRPVTHVATGSLYGLANATQPSDALVQAIKPNTFVQMPAGGHQQPDGDILVVAPTAARAGARLIDRLSDYYAGWPYQFSWSTWTPFVNSQIAAIKASPYYSSVAAYAPWNESDNTWLSSNGTFEAFWTTTYRQIRSLDPNKPIQGPSFSDNISDMRNFLTNAVATNTVPDILAWHELSTSSKIAGDVATVQAIEQQLGISPRPIAIEEYAAPSEVGIPGPLVGYIAKFERLGIHDAELAFWNQSGALGDLLTGKGGSPNSAYWLYTWYAGMSGNMVATTPPAQSGIDGFAAVPASNDQVSIVVGGCSGSCAVTVNGLNALSLGATVNVKVEQTASLGRTVASSGPSTISTATYTPSSGSISVPITMSSSNAYRITITPGSGTTQGGPISISAGGAASGAFVADVDYSGGSTYSTTSAIDTSQLSGTVPPQSVLQHERYGAFTYTIPGLTAGSPYTVTLYFAEFYWTAAGQRLFNVAINGSTVLSAFDIFSAAGGANKAIARAFNTTANASGQVVVTFTAGSVDNPKVDGLSVAAGSTSTSYPLTVSKSGTGSGTVAGGAISCGSTCSASLAAGTTVTLTAAPASGSTFAGWSGACTGTGACAVTMTAAQAVTATFNTSSVTTYALTVTKAGTGSGTVAGGAISCGSTCSASLAAGTTVTLTAAPASGATFAGWSGACTGTGACSVTMSAAQTVTATFASNGGSCTAVSGGQSGNFNTTGAICFTVSATINGWGCSNADGRSVTVNGTAVTCGQLPLPGSVPYTFSFTAGTYPWASFYWW